MSRYECDIVTQGPELCDDGFDKGVMIAAWEIRPADGALEKHVTDSGELRWIVEENYMSRRMPRAVAHGERLLSDGDCVVAVEPAVGREGAGVDAIFFSRFFNLINPKLIFRMRPLDG